MRVPLIPWRGSPTHWTMAAPAVTALAVLLLVLPACSDDDDDDAPTASPSVTAQTTAAAVSPSPEPAGDNPFRVSGPDGPPQDLAGPEGLDAAPAETDVDALGRLIPSFRLLADADRASFALTSAVGRSADGGAAWTTYYSDEAQRRSLVVAGWTKSDTFNLTVVPDSPVTEATVTAIDGLPALTLLPTAAVAGGLGPRTAFLYHGGIIYRLDGEGFVSDEAFMDVVHNFIGEVTR